LSEAQLRRELGLRDLVLFNIAAVVGVRWLAAAAHVGPSGLVLWALAAALFFLPCALTVAELATRFPSEGGYYVWTRHAFGEWHGFVCGWMAWWSNLVYFPNLALAIVGMAVYIAGPQYAWLGEDRRFALAASLAVFWIPTITNVVGLRVGKWTQNIGGMATNATGVLLVILALAIWRSGGAPNSFAAREWIPSWNFEKLNFWSQIALALVGIELSSLMSAEMKHPQRDIPRAIVLSTFAIAGLLMLGTGALLFLLPAEQINVVTGVVQGAQAAGEKLGAAWVGRVAALLASAGLTGQLGAWVAGSARLPFVIGIDGRLPAILGRVHPRWATPHVALLAQGAISTVLLLVAQIGETARGAYLILVDLTVIASLLPYVYFFAALIKLRNDPERGQRPEHVLVPGGHAGVFAIGGIGAAVTLLAMALALVPAPGTSSVWLFEFKAIGGTLLALAAGAYFYSRRREAR
jgi:amino acid transporter